jgi:hypothetical protein
MTKSQNPLCRLLILKGKKGGCCRNSALISKGLRPKHDTRQDERQKGRNSALISKGLRPKHDTRQDERQKGRNSALISKGLRQPAKPFGKDDSVATQP